MIRNTIGHTRDEIFTVPNLITTCGIISIFLYAYCFLWRVQEAYIPLLVFVAGCSDLLDGLFARMLDQHSRLGKMLDPIRDRLLGAAILINIVIANPAVWKLAILMCVFEVIIAAIHTYHRRTTGVLARTHFSGKIRQTIHLIAAGMFVFQTYMPFWNAIGIPPIPIFAFTFAMFIATVFAFMTLVIK